MISESKSRLYVVTSLIISTSHVNVLFIDTKVQFLLLM